MSRPKPSTLLASGRTDVSNWGRRAGAVRDASQRWQAASWAAYFAAKDHFGESSSETIQAEIAAEQAEVIAGLWRDLADAHQACQEVSPTDLDAVAIDNLQRRAAEHFGKLLSVFAATDLPRSDAIPTRYDSYEFVFERGSFVVGAFPHDDTVRVVEGRLGTGHVVDMARELPWSRAIGSGVLWIWILENQSGYRDGFQIQFGQPSGNLTIQLVCEASLLTAGMVSEVRGQFADNGTRPLPQSTDGSAE